MNYVKQDLSTIFNSILEDFVVLYIYIYINFDYMILNFIVMITQNIECLLWQTSHLAFVSLTYSTS
jgi:hypothetical protein